MKTIREHFAPNVRSGRWVPEQRRRQAVRLTASVGPRIAAYVYGVSEGRLRYWCKLYGHAAT